jgi:hypothetical protein
VISVKMPVQDDLSNWSVVLSSEFLNNRFFQEIKRFVLLSLEWPGEGTKRCVSSDIDTKLL